MYQCLCCGRRCHSERVGAKEEESEVSREEKSEVGCESEVVGCSELEVLSELKEVACFTAFFVLLLVSKSDGWFLSYETRLIGELGWLFLLLVNTEQDH